MNKAVNILNIPGDQPLAITVKAGRCILCIQMIERSALVVVYQANMPAQCIGGKWTHVVDLIGKVLAVASNLTDVATSP